MNVIEVHWVYYIRVESFWVWFGQQDDGKWLAVRAIKRGRPRFCLAAPTLEEAKDKARRAIRFWRKAKDKIPR